MQGEMGAMTEEIGKKLKTLRNQAGLSSRAVAERVGMPASTYQKYEDRYRRPYLPLHLVAKLVQALGREGIAADKIWELAEPTQIEAFHQAWAARSDGSVVTGVERPNASDPFVWQPSMSDRRRYSRFAPLAANLAHDGERHSCVIRDISPAGACVLAEAAVKLGEAADVFLELSGRSAVPARVMRADGNEIGLMFADGEVGEREMAEWLAPMCQMMH